MKCLILFSGKNKKIIVTLPSAELAQRVLKVKEPAALKENRFWTSSGGLLRQL